MKSAMKCFSMAAFSLMISVAVAQVPESTDAFPDFTGGNKTSTPATTTPTTTTQPQTQQPAASSSTTTQQPSGGTTPKVEPVENNGESTPPDPDAPLDGIVQRKLILDKQLLPWEPIREADILWSKRVWRVIDVREKINLPFIYPEMPFFTILQNGIQKDSSIKAYKAENDKFHYRLSSKDLQNLLNTVDTISQLDPTTYETKLRIVYNTLNPKDITRYRIKEDWYFDRQQSVLKVRILGIAPLKDVKNEAGEFMYEQPLFWIRYPDCREYLARNRAFIEGNDSNPMSWEDLFEQRRFSSYVTKESNVHNRRLQEYLQGVDLLLEGEKIKAEIFNYEHDLWSY